MLPGGGGAFIETESFHHSNLSSVLRKFYQNVSCATRGQKTPDHVYTNVSDAYKATPSPTLDNRLSLFPKRSLVVKGVKPTMRTLKVWLEGADPAFQQLFQDTDWNAFTTWDCHSVINCSYTVLGHISKCVDRVTTHKKIKSFPNQPSWIKSEVSLLPTARDAAFRSAQPGQT